MTQKEYDRLWGQGGTVADLMPAFLTTLAAQQRGEKIPHRYRNSVQYVAPGEGSTVAELITLLGCDEPWHQDQQWKTNLLITGGTRTDYDTERIEKSIEILYTGAVR